MPDELLVRFQKQICPIQPRIPEYFLSWGWELKVLDRLNLGSRFCHRGLRHQEISLIFITLWKVFCMVSVRGYIYIIRKLDMNYMENALVK